MIDRKELVEKMVGVYEQHGRVCGLDPAEERFFNERRQAMDAALSVAIEELLKPVTNEERLGWPRMQRLTNCWHELNDDQKADVLLNDRRAQLERVKTPREQIEAVIDKHRAQINNGRTPMDDMVIELTGLIQQLKGSA